MANLEQWRQRIIVGWRHAVELAIGHGIYFFVFPAIFGACVLAWRYLPLASSDERDNILAGLVVLLSLTLLIIRLRAEHHPVLQFQKQLLANGFVHVPNRRRSRGIVRLGPISKPIPYDFFVDPALEIEEFLGCLIPPLDSGHKVNQERFAERLERVRPDFDETWKTI